ncbi:EmrB/QacA subfamily drug resistance transporter [Kitasatospora sp. MAP12-15]|uniref:MFS transporter n=1 Tax=unclassified Kitasatospora TaxID=2633591 RepID=UPI0024744851|nr:MFS transporter [Kitasatospora sp. MAP12-44]MDH6113681.1 EmrB/QacA subfamily drug resistance transporter [Kitasatospora sp. MAP12-44]
MQTEIGQGRRQAILVLLALTGLVVVMDLTIQNVALETIQRELHASSAGLEWSMDSYLITFAAFIFTGGVSADRFGRKKTLLAGLILFGASSALAASSTSIGELILWRSLMGVGAALVPSVSLAILINVFPPAERPRAIGWWAGAAGIALAVGPVIGGMLLEVLWWGSVFLVNAPVILAAVALIIWLVPESRNPNNNSFDPLGVLISVLAVGTLVYGIVRGGDHDDWLSLATAGPIVLGLALVALLVKVESRIKHPALDLSFLRSVRYSAGTFALALAFFAVLGAFFITALYFQGVHGYSPFTAGMLMLPMGLGSWLMSFRSAKMAARFGAGPVVGGGALAIAVAFAGFSQMDKSTGMPLIVLAQVLFGLGWGSMVAPATAALMSDVPMVKAGAGQAVSQTVRQVAGALGVAIIGSLLAVSYRSSLGSAIDVLPADVRDQAASSLGATMHAITQAGLQPGQVAALTTRATQAYLDGMQVTMLTLTAVSLAAAFIAYRWLPGAAKAAPAAPVAPVAVAQPAKGEPART